MSLERGSVILAREAEKCLDALSSARFGQSSSHSCMFQTSRLVFVAPLSNPRSTLTYGFTELRVENLIDLPQAQSPITVQVFEKRLDGFQIALSPIPPTPNYFLAVRTP